MTLKLKGNLQQSKEKKKRHMYMFNPFPKITKKKKSYF